MTIHPYRGLPAHQFWSTGIAPVAAADLDPVVSVPFVFSPSDPVAAAGSCFAQHIARHLKASGYNFLQAEPPLSPTEPVFSARYGNIYTVRQLRQLLAGAYGLHRPATRVWRRPDGRFIDPLRPQLFPEGFATADDVIAARRDHLQAVRGMFEQCVVFVFTLGLTESWLAPDGTALPVPPGALGIEPPGGEPHFHNFSVAEMRQDMEQFLTDFRDINPAARVILTVSPVPLVATYEQRHVLVSNTYSKAALRVVAEETAHAHDTVAYFPSYEIITAPQVRGAYFEADLRNVGEAGVSHVMRVFSAHMMSADAGAAAPPPPPSGEAVVPSAEARARYAALAEVLCDEELLDAGPDA
ncbi:MAG: GSCFA domain-containing protein [Rhodospirillales bacterium]